MGKVPIQSAEYYRLKSESEKVKKKLEELEKKYLKKNKGKVNEPTERQQD